jgi:hypothetical protein
VIKRVWSWTPGARQIAALSAEVHRLTAAIERLEAVQRKDAQQLKKLRDTVTAGTATAQRALEAGAASSAAFDRAAERLQGAERDAFFERLDAMRRTDAKWRKIFSQQLTALLRHICLPLDRLEPPHSLDARRFRLRSQNEEDGVLLALLALAGWGATRFVEIGSGKSGGNSAGLAHECGWSGLLIDVSVRSIEQARAKFAANRGITAVAARVTPANVNELLATHGFDRDVDVLSIDIDSYDYWILEALTVAPRIMVLEYNALFGPDRRVTIPLDHPIDAAPKGYGGASLAALTALAAGKGYRLVTCEHAGVNAFFLRDDVARQVRAVSVAEAFKPLRNRLDIDDAEIVSDLFATVARLNLPLVEV